MGVARCLGIFASDANQLSSVDLQFINVLLICRK